MAHSESFSKSLFLGEIHENMIFPFPEISKEEAETLRLMIDTLKKYRESGIDPEKWDEDGELPPEVVKNLGEMGFLGLAIPQEYNGLGLSSTAYVRVMQELVSTDSSIAVTLGAHQSIGFKALTLFGTKEQKERFYPRLATGELLACFALTEAGSGSDAGSIKTKAKLSSDGKHFLINGEKIWITNGGIASYITVFAKTDEPDEAGGTKEKVTAFIVELPADGVTFGPPENKMGIRASHTTSIHFENVKVPAENILGGRGKGFKVAMEVLNNGRLGLAGGAVGGSKICIRRAIEHATQRKQFGSRIGDFGMIQGKIGRMIVDTFVAESMVYMTTSLIDRKEFDYSLESAISKVFASEMLWRNVNETLQIYGGMGYMKESGLERMVRDSRINLIFEGTNEILRLFIGLSGLQGPGQTLTEVAKALKEPVKQVGVLSDFAVKRFKLNVVGPSMTKTHSLLKKEAGMLEDYVAEFALQCQKLLQRHGKHIAERQFAVKRVGDIAIDLFAMSCTLSRVTGLLQTKGPENCEMELAIAFSFFMEANRRIRGNFKSIDRNDDDALKLLANKHYELGGYPWDMV